jgi:diguanylate cyclase (GGDEF)-like protein/PAS domain S-box-containing protein
MAVAAAAAYVAIYAVAAALRPAGGYLRLPSDLVFHLPGFFALCLVAWRARRSGGAERAGFALIAATLLCWQAGDWFLTYHDYASGARAPFPSLADLCYYAGYAALLIAVPVLVFPVERLRDRRWLLDAAIVVVAAGALAWQFAFTPQIRGGDGTAFAATVALGYPLLNLGLCISLLLSLYGGGRGVSGRALVLGAACLAQIASAPFHIGDLTLGGYHAPGNVIELGWPLAGALFAAACLVPYVRVPAPAARSRDSVPRLLFPYAATVPIVIVTLALSLRSTPSPVLLWCAMASVTLVLLRQVLTLRENAKLYRDLERDHAEHAAWLQAESDLGEVLLVLDGWRVARVNGAAERISGYSADQLALLPSVLDLIASDERAALEEWIERRADGEDVPVQCESAIVRPDGSRVDIEFAFTEMNGAGDTRTMIVARDITERRRAQAAVARSEARFRSLVEAAGNVIITVDTDGRVVEFNPEAERIFGRPYDDVGGRDFAEVVMPSTPREETVAHLRRVLEGKVWRALEMPNDQADDSTPSILWNVTRYVDAHGTPEGVIIVGQDITQRKRGEQELWAALDELAASRAEIESQSELLEFTLAAERENARRDSLTNTLNHRAITEVIEERVQAGVTNPHLCAVIMVDVDGMKAVNDTFGHLAGDAVLVHVSGALFRSGAIVGRYGGDEFVVVLPGASRDAAERYRHAVLDGLAVANLTDPVSGSSIPLQASIGIAIYPDEAESVADLIRLADGAMYAVKRERSAAPDAPRRNRLADERAARMVGEIVPLLTSPGDLEDKMRLVSRRLSVGAGYDGVSFTLFAPSPGRARAVTASAPFDSAAETAWLRIQFDDGTGLSPIRALLEASRQPIIIDDVARHAAISAEQRDALAATGMRSGLVVPMIWEGQLVGALAVGSRRESAFNARDAQFVAAVATQVTAIVRTHRLVGELEAATARLAGAQAETVMMLAAAAEAHDRTTGLHLVSIRKLAEQLAGELGYASDEVDQLGLAAVLHDIGKISVPDAVLSSSGRLEGDDWGLMKRHTVWGAEFLSGKPEFRLAQLVARSHHERWDGGGYPDGLAADQIPEAAQIVTVADSFDAMTHDRPYKKGRSVREAVAEILSCSGKQFSPRVVAALVRVYDRGELTGEEHLAQAA